MSAYCSNYCVNMKSEMITIILESDKRKIMFKKRINGNDGMLLRQELCPYFSSVISNVLIQEKHFPQKKFKKCFYYVTQ